MPPAAAPRDADLRAEPAPRNRSAEVGPRACPLPRDPLQLPVLLVNRLFVPVQVTTARRGLLLLFGGAALALDEAGELHEFARWRDLPVRERDDALPIVGGALRVPRILHLRRYERVRRAAVRLTRRNLMLRDGHQCQYCARHAPVRDLNIGRAGSPVTYDITDGQGKTVGQYITPGSYSNCVRRCWRTASSGHCAK